MLPWLADLLILLGLLVMTVGVYGVVRLPDVYTQLHASSKAAFVGLVALIAAAASTGDGAIVARGVLIATLLAFTTPVAAHAVGQAANRRAETMRTPGAVDERTAVRHAQPDRPAPAAPPRGGPAG